MPTDLLLVAVALARPLAFAAVVPLVGAPGQPWTRVVFGLAIALVAFPQVILATFSAAPLPSTVFREIVIGLCLGLAATTVLAVGRVAGGMVDAMMPGWRAPNGLLGTGSSGPFSVLLTLATVVVFVTLGGHIVLIEAVMASYQMWPVGPSTTASGGLLLAALASAGAFFLVAAMVALPVMFALASAELAVGLAVRFAGWTPQQIPLRLVIGLSFAVLILYAASSVLVRWMLRSALVIS